MCDFDHHSDMCDFDHHSDSDRSIDVNSEISDEEQNVNTKEPNELKIMIEMLQAKIMDPEIAQLMVMMTKIINPKFSAIVSLCGKKSEQYLVEFQASFINALSQNEFDKLMTRFCCSLPIKTVRLLSDDKLIAWIKKAELSYLINNRAYTFIKILVSRDLLPEGCETTFLEEYIAGCTFKPSQNYLDTLELILMTYDGRFVIDYAACKKIEVLQVINKYLTNKNVMLKLECETKDRYIDEIKSNMK
jgi:hypothetical protein